MEIKESNYGIEAYYRRGGKKRYYEDRFAGGIGAEDFLLPKDVNGGGGQRLKGAMDSDYYVNKDKDTAIKNAVYGTDNLIKDTIAKNPDADQNVLLEDVNKKSLVPVGSERFAKVKAEFDKMTNEEKSEYLADAYSRIESTLTPFFSQFIDEEKYKGQIRRVRGIYGEFLSSLGVQYRYNDSNGKIEFVDENGKFTPIREKGFFEGLWDSFYANKYAIGSAIVGTAVVGATIATGGGLGAIVGRYLADVGASYLFSLADIKALEDEYGIRIDKTSQEYARVNGVVDNVAFGALIGGVGKLLGKTFRAGKAIKSELFGDKKNTKRILDGYRKVSGVGLSNEEYFSLTKKKDYNALGQKLIKNATNDQLEQFTSLVEGGKSPILSAIEVQPEMAHSLDKVSRNILYIEKAVEDAIHKKFGEAGEDVVSHVEDIKTIYQIKEYAFQRLNELLNDVDFTLAGKGLADDAFKFGNIREYVEDILQEANDKYVAMTAGSTTDASGRSLTKGTRKLDTDTSFTDVNKIMKNYEEYAKKTVNPISKSEYLNRELAKAVPTTNITSPFAELASDLLKSLQIEDTAKRSGTGVFRLLNNALPKAIENLFTLEPSKMGRLLNTSNNKELLSFLAGEARNRISKDLIEYSRVAGDELADAVEMSLEYANLAYSKYSNFKRNLGKKFAVDVNDAMSFLDATQKSFNAININSKPNRISASMNEFLDIARGIDEYYTKNGFPTQAIYSDRVEKMIVKELKNRIVYGDMNATDALRVISGTNIKKETELVSDFISNLRSLNDIDLAMSTTESMLERIQKLNKNAVKEASTIAEPISEAIGASYGVATGNIISAYGMTRIAYNALRKTLFKQDADKGVKSLLKEVSQNINGMNIPLRDNILKTAEKILPPNAYTGLSELLTQEALLNERIIKEVGEQASMYTATKISDGVEKIISKKRIPVGTLGEYSTGKDDYNYYDYKVGVLDDIDEMVKANSKLLVSIDASYNDFQRDLYRLKTVNENILPMWWNEFKTKYGAVIRAYRGRNSVTGIVVNGDYGEMILK